MAGERLRAFRAHKLGLDGALMGQPAAEILTRTGWARSVAGVGPYLTLFTRGGIRRAEADAAVAAAEIHELPAARGCTYVLPASDYALGLKLGQPFTEIETKVAMKLGVTASEIERLKLAVLKALASGPLDTDGLRTAVGKAARSLGPEGVKKGIATTLPVALGILQSEGEIRRIPINGRLDQQKYKYALWNPNPLAGFKLSLDACLTETGRRYFQWLGAASLAEFQWFSGVSGKAAKAALQPLDLREIQTEVNSALMLPEHHSEFESFKMPHKADYRLVGSLDGINAFQRNLKNLLELQDLARVIALKGKVEDLPNHAILDRGRLVGLWEFDPGEGRIVWLSFVKADAAMREAVGLTEAYLRDELGDARSGSLDSPKSRAPRIEALRKAASA